jgi:hypothetical protein
MKTKIRIVSLVALMAILVMTGCAGPAVRHDYRVDNRVENRDDRQDNRYDRRDARLGY